MPPALEDAHGQLGDHGQVRLEHLADYFAEALILLEGLDLFDLAEGLEGIVVQIVYVADVGVGDNAIGQLLHVPDAVRDASKRAHGQLEH